MTTSEFWVVDAEEKHSLDLSQFIVENSKTIIATEFFWFFLE